MDDGWRLVEDSLLMTQLASILNLLSPNCYPPSVLCMKYKIFQQRLNLFFMIYDAIVVGSGISGGWAAKELCQKGLKTLLLERGRNVEHSKDYTTASMRPWEFANRLEMTEKDRAENP